MFGLLPFFFALVHVPGTGPKWTYVWPSLYSSVAGWTVATSSPFAYFSFFFKYWSICFFPPSVCVRLSTLLYLIFPCNFMFSFLFLLVVFPFLFVLYVPGTGQKWMYYCVCIICTGYCLLLVVLCLCCRCCSMLLLNVNAHRSCALCGVGAARSCYTVCMLYDTTMYRPKVRTYCYLCILHWILLAVCRGAGAAAAAACCVWLDWHAHKSCTALMLLLLYVCIVLLRLAFVVGLPLLLLAVVVSTCIMNPCINMQTLSSHREARFRPGFEPCSRKHELRSTSRHAVSWTCPTLPALPDPAGGGFGRSRFVVIGPVK